MKRFLIHKLYYNRIKKTFQFNKIVEKIYENSAISLIGCRKILLVNGGAGTGKTKFISSLLQKFKEENFQYSKSILVCGIKHELVDRMAAPFRKIKSIGNFSKNYTKYICCKIFDLYLFDFVIFS